MCSVVAIQAYSVMLIRNNSFTGVESTERNLFNNAVAFL